MKTIAHHWKSAGRTIVVTAPDHTGIAAVLASTTINTGAPPGLIEVRNASCVHRSHCAFDEAGQPIPLSVHRRRHQIGAAPTAPPAGTQFTMVEEPTLYLGFFMDHWGHFLTESLARLWAQKQVSVQTGTPPQLAVTGPDNPRAGRRHANTVAFLAGIGITADRFHPVGRPLRFRRLFIPEPDFINQIGCWTVHADLSRRAASAILGDDRPTRRRVIYLSRTRLDVRRAIRGEGELEQRLAAEGVEIVHAQDLTLAEQVRLWAETRVAIGCIGSALHGVCLCLDPGVQTHVLYGGQPNRNFFLFDALYGVDAHYLEAIAPTAGIEQTLPARDNSIDVERVMAYLADQGVLKL